MKKMFIVLGIALVIMGCASSPEIEISTEPTKFEGSWRNPAGRNVILTFKGNTWTRDDNYGKGRGNGTFEFDDKQITFRPILELGYWKQKYTLENNKLNLQRKGDRFFGTFIKMVKMPEIEISMELTKFEGSWKNPNSQRGLTYTFKGNTWEQTSTNGKPITGTFEFDDKQITFYSTYDSWKQNYTLENDTLRLQRDGNHNFGQFNKQ